MRAGPTSADQEHWNLRVFCEVAEQQSVSLAARRLTMSQPGVSMVIHRLEEHYRSPLVVRSGRNRVALTEAGAELYRHALGTLRSARELDARIRALNRDRAGLVAFAARTSVSQHYLPPIVLQFWREHPNVEIRVVNINTRVVPEAVLDGTVEFAVLPLGEGVAGPALTIERFHREPLVIVAAPDHPLVRRDGLSLADLAEERFVVYSRDSDRLSLLRERLRAGGDVQLRIAIEANDEAAKYLVQAGVGLSLMLHCSVERELARGELCTISSPELDLYLDLAIVYRQDHRFSALAARLIDLIRERGKVPLPEADEPLGTDL